MRRQFDAACRQYEVKAAQGKNLLNLDTKQLNDLIRESPWVPLIHRCDRSQINFKKNTQYTVSAEIEVPDGTYVCIDVRFEHPSGFLSSGSLVQGESGLTGLYSLTSIPGETISSIEIEILCSGFFEVKWVQIEDGATATAYEPYGTHGHAEWNDGLKSGFPSVKMLGKTEQQSYTGKNLFNFVGRKQIEMEWGAPDTARNFDGNGIYLHLAANNYSNPNSGNSMSVDANKGTISIDASSVGYGIGVDFHLPGGEQYAVSCAGENTEFMVSFYDKDGVFLLYQDIGSVFTVPTNAYWTIILLRAYDFGEAFFSNIQLERGCIATAYEPYVVGVPPLSPDYPQEVTANNACVASCGKNLLKLADQVIEDIRTGAMCTISDGLVSVEGDYTTLSLFNLVAGSPQPILPPGTYTLYTGVGTDVYYIPYDAEGNAGARAYAMSVKFVVLTLEHPFQLTIINLYHNSSHHLEQPIYPMLLKGTYTLEELPEGEPYFDGGEATAPVLYAIGDYKDEWDAQTGKGIRRIAKVTLTGSESYVIQDNKVNTFRYSINPDGMINTPYQNNAFALCSHLPTDVSDGDVEHCCGRNNSFHLFVSKNRLQGTTIDKWIKAQYDSGTPVTIWYVLNEPVPFQTNPQRLTCPTGYGQLIQTAGDVPNAPLEVKYLAHGGNVK